MQAVDFFFSPHQTSQERRRRAAIQDGLAHGGQMLPRDPSPGELVSLLFTTNAQMPIEQVAVYYTTDGSTPAGRRGVAQSGVVALAEPGETADDAALHLPVRRWRAVIGGQPEGTLVRYCADGWSLQDSQAHWHADAVDPAGPPPHPGRLFAYSVDRWRPPEWLADAVIYQVFIDRFSAASDEPPLHDPGSITSFFGGTLRGVQEKLAYIQALGATCIWLSPVFESPTSHGYDPSDYHQVARRFGNNELLRQLIAEAHQRGMRVLLDFVANHTSDQHPGFLDARANPQSRWATWYSFGDWFPYGYRSYGQVQSMPELVTENAEVQRYLIDAALYWLEHFEVDGLRLDHVSGPTTAFWAIFQRALKQRFPQALTLGEISGPLSEFGAYAGRMDAFMDFPLAGMLRRVFAQRSTPLAELLTYLEKRRPDMPPGMAPATLLDNHDMHRFLWLAAGSIARLKLAALCQMTLEGTPIIYYGTEVGLSQYGDAHLENAYARAPMMWDGYQDQSLLSFYRHLVALRHAHPSLRRGRHIPLVVEAVGVPAEAAAQVGGYLRSLENDHLLVMLNNNEQPVTLCARLPRQHPLADASGDMPTSLHNIMEPASSAEIMVQDGVVELTLPALGAALLERR